MSAIKFRDWIATRTGAANQSLLSNARPELPVGQRTSGPSYPMSRKGRMRQFVRDLTQPRLFTRTHDRTPPLAYRRFGSKAGHRKTRKPRRTERNGLCATRVIVEAGNRAYVISSSRSPAEYARTYVVHTDAHERRMTLLADPLFRRNLTTGSLTRSPLQRSTDLLRHFGRQNLETIFVGYYGRQYFTKAEWTEWNIFRDLLKLVWNSNDSFMFRKILWY